MELRKWLTPVSVGLTLWVGAVAPGAFAEPPAAATKTRSALRFSCAPYAKISARRLETMRLTRESKFDAVEALLTPVQQAYERNEVDEFAAATAFAPYSTSDPTLGPPLDRWVAQAPKSYSARLARARYLRQSFYRYRSAESPHSDVAIGPDRLLALAKRSIADYQAALAMNPKLMVAYSDLIEMAAATNDTALMRESYRNALEVDPSTWPARDALYRVGAVSRANFAAFLADAEKHEKANPVLLQLRSDVEIARADSLWMNGQYAPALAIYDEQLERVEMFVTRKNRARLLRVMERLPEALAEADRAIALMPGKYDGYRERGWVYHAMGRWADAVADFRRGLEIDPLEPELNRGLASALDQAGDYAGSEAAFELSARWAPDTEVFYKLGLMQLDKAKNPKKALAAFEHAVAIDPKDKWNWYMQARALDALGDSRTALSYKRFLALADARSPRDRQYIAFAKQRMSAAPYAPPPPASVR